MEKRNIYNHNKDSSPKDESLPTVDLTMAQARARTIRSTLWFLGIVLVLLGAASWVVYLQESKLEAETNLTNEIGYLTSFSLEKAAASNTLALPFKSALATPTQATSFAQSDRPKIDPAVMAHAIGEVRIGSQYLRAGDLDKAENHALKALEIYPAINAGQRLLGLIYVQRGQFDQAIYMLEQALQTDPFNAETFNNLASAYMQKKMFDKAEELLQNALQIQPGFVPAYFNMGLISLASGRYAACADYLEQALSAQPNNPSARNNLAVALARLGRLEEARRQLQIIVDQNPDIAASYFNMAITYTIEARAPEAMDWIRRGSEHCTPVTCQKYLADVDFNPIRNTREFQQFVNGLYPKHPASLNIDSLFPTRGQ